VRLVGERREARRADVDRGEELLVPAGGGEIEEPAAGRE